MDHATCTEAGDELVRLLKSTTARRDDLRPALNAAKKLFCDGDKQCARLLMLIGIATEVANPGSRIDESQAHAYRVQARRRGMSIKTEISYAELRYEALFQRSHRSRAAMSDAMRTAYSVAAIKAESALIELRRLGEHCRSSRTIVTSA